jgi:hypothetical protein
MLNRKKAKMRTRSSRVRNMRRTNMMWWLDAMMNALGLIDLWLAATSDLRWSVQEPLLKHEFSLRVSKRLRIASASSIGASIAPESPLASIRVCKHGQRKLSAS